MVKGKTFTPDQKAAAVAALDGGESYKDIAKRLGLKSASAIYRWRNGVAASGATAARSATVVKTDTGNLNNILRDVLIYLRDGEREVMQMMREGAIKKPDRAHLMLQLALAEIEKALK